MTRQPMTRRDGMVLLTDLLLVVVFAAIGRAEHDRGNPVLGALETAWPFLVGVVVGWVLVRRLSQRWASDLGPGVTVWLSAVVVGMLLRQLTGQGTAFSFVVVATLVLGVFLLGGRVVHAFLAGRGAYSAKDE